MPALEQLLELSKDPRKLGTLDLLAAAGRFATKIADHIRPQVQQAPLVLKPRVAGLTEADVVSFEEIARAVTAAILLAMPKLRKPILGSRVGLGWSRRWLTTL